MKKFLLPLLLTLFFCFPVWAKAYQVTRVIDGDTFDATDGVISFRVRIIGMDAPESKQPYGKLTTYKLKQLIEDKEITLQTNPKTPKDHYNRVLANVFVGKVNVAERLIEDGHAYYYRPRCRNYPEDKKLYNYDPIAFIEAENMARFHQKGLWANDNNILPCKFRKQNK